jgi:hypothetical protein
MVWLAVIDRTRLRQGWIHQSDIPLFFLLYGNVCPFIWQRLQEVNNIYYTRDIMHVEINVMHHTHSTTISTNLQVESRQLMFECSTQYRGLTE